MNDIRYLSDGVKNLQSQGATDEQIAEYLQNAGVSPEQYIYEVQRLSEAGGSFEPLGMVEGLAGQAAQGLGFGFADEVGGFAQALMDKAGGAEAPVSELYSQSRAKADLANADFQRRHPNLSPWASTPAAMAAPGGMIKGGSSLLMRSADSALRRVGAGAYAGGAAGATAGYGSAPPGQRVEGAYTGAAAGAAIGGAIPGAAEAFGALKAPAARLASYVQDVTGVKLSGGAGAGGAVPSGLPAGQPPQSGSGAVLDAIERDGRTPGGMLEGARAAREAGAPLPLVAQGGPNLRGLARATVTLPGQGRSLAEGNISRQVSGGQAGPRIEGYVEELSGMPAVDTDGLLAQRAAADRASSQAAYAKAFEGGSLPLKDDEQLLTLLQAAPAYRKAHERVRAGLDDVSVGDEARVPALFDEQGRLIREPTVEDIDIIKKGLDRRLSDAKGGLTITSAQSDDKIILSELMSTRDQLLTAVDQRAPAYAAARAQFGDALEIRNAAELGQTALNLSPREITAEMRRMSEAARTEFQRSAQDAIRLRLQEAAARGKHTNLAKEIFGVGDGYDSKRASLAAIFGDGEKFARFEQQMRNMLELYDTNNFLVGGSQTANKLAEVDDLAAGEAVAGVAGSLASGNPAHAASGLVSRLAGGVTSRAQSATFEGTRNAIAENLFRPGSSADEADAFLMALERLRTQRIAAAGRLPFYTAVGSSAAGATQGR